MSMGGITVDRIVNDPSLRSLAYKVIDETIAVANADLRKNWCAEDEMLGEETVSFSYVVVLGCIILLACQYNSYPCATII